MDLKTLNSLPSIQKRQRRKRVGRGPGSGNGKTSGRGHKGAGARSGHRKRDYWEGGNIPLIRRFPKRGFSNARFKKTFAIVNVGELNRFEDGAEVTVETLKLAGLVRNELDGVKLLGDGDLERKGLKVTVHKLSGSAREKLEQAGCTVEALTPPKKVKPGKRQFAAWAKERGVAEAGKPKSRSEDEE